MQGKEENMNALRRFMAGRYGGDPLNFFLLGLGIVVMLLVSILSRLSVPDVVLLILDGVYFAILILAVFRMLSRNIYRRQRENAVFLNAWNAVRRVFRRRSDAKTHCRFRCPQCRQSVRVPRGKGKISITCPKCGTKFIKKT